MKYKVEILQFKIKIPLFHHLKMTTLSLEKIIKWVFQNLLILIKKIVAILKLIEMIHKVEREKNRKNKTLNKSKNYNSKCK
jgi:hypothetical protein